MRKMPILPELKQEFFQFLPDTLKHPTLHLSWPISLPSNLKNHQESEKNVFLDKFLNSSLIFDPLPILGISSKFYCTP